MTLGPDSFIEKLKPEQKRLILQGIDFFDFDRQHSLLPSEKLRALLNKVPGYAGKEETQDRKSVV